MGIGEHMICELAVLHLLSFFFLSSSVGWLCPLDVEDEMVVAEPVEGGDRLRRVLLPESR